MIDLEAVKATLTSIAQAGSANEALIALAPALDFPVPVWCDDVNRLMWQWDLEALTQRTQELFDGVQGEGE